MRVVMLAAAMHAAVLGASSASARDHAAVTLLSYNVKGLPWPVTSGRPAALRAIARQLWSMRQQGRQPGVVALQEAFVPEAKAIGRAAGYRYMALGPNLDASAEPATTADDRAFMADRNFMIGERNGKHADSGLVIFSDYPIVAIRRMVYPVCAGFDCLANKGALAVQLAIPGVASRLTVIDSHLNSGTASGAVRVRSNYAFYRQLDALQGFIASVAASGAPILIAGDLNVGRLEDRRGYFVSHLLGRSSGVFAAELLCGRDRRCVSGGPGVAESIKHGKDWLLYRSSPSLALTPTEVRAPFGRAADGAMLSDHIGISATYTLVAFPHARIVLATSG